MLLEVYSEHLCAFLVRIVFICSFLVRYVRAKYALGARYVTYYDDPSLPAAAK